MAYKLDQEGPHVFFEDNSFVVNYVRGGKPEGFYNDQTIYSLDSDIPAKTYFALEQQFFDFEINPRIKTPHSIYDDNHPIIAISDIDVSAGDQTFEIY